MSKKYKFFLSSLVVIALVVVYFISRSVSPEAGSKLSIKMLGQEVIVETSGIRASHDEITAAASALTHYLDSGSGFMFRLPGKDWSGAMQIHGLTALDQFVKFRFSHLRSFYSSIPTQLFLLLPIIEKGHWVRLVHGKAITVEIPNDSEHEVSEANATRARLKATLKAMDIDLGKVLDEKDKKKLTNDLIKSDKESTDK
jgi:hypothetical protein